MRLLIDTSQVTFTVSRAAQARNDQNGVQRTTKSEDGTIVPTWTVQLVAMDAAGAEVINVTYAGHNPPKVAVGQPVSPIALQAIPWAQNGKNGTAFRATDFKTVSAAKSTSSAA